MDGCVPNKSVCTGTLFEEGTCTPKQSVLLDVVVRAAAILLLVLVAAAKEATAVTALLLMESFLGDDRTFFCGEGVTSDACVCRFILLSEDDLLVAVLVARGERRKEDDGAMVSIFVPF